MTPPPGQTADQHEPPAAFAQLTPASPSGTGSRSLTSHTSMNRLRRPGATRTRNATVRRATGNIDEAIGGLTTASVARTAFVTSSETTSSAVSARSASSHPRNWHRTNARARRGAVAADPNTLYAVLRPSWEEKARSALRWKALDGPAGEDRDGRSGNTHASDHLS